MIETSLCNLFQLTPMSVFHELRMQRTHKRQHCSHILDFVHNNIVSLEISDFLREILNLSSKCLVGIKEYICFDLSPRLSLPIIVLIVDQCNSIPHRFEVLQVIHAVFQLLVVTLVKLEKFLKVVIFLRSLLHSYDLAIVQHDSVIAVVNVIDAHAVGVVEWEILQEFFSELFDFLHENI